MVISRGELFDARGHRLYLTIAERSAFLKAAANATPQVETFCQMLAHTGCRPSELLALTPRSFDMELRAVVVESLKKRRKGSFRLIPLREKLLLHLNRVHRLVWWQAKGEAVEMPRLWPWCRTTAYLDVKHLMKAARIQGPQATSKGLRHGFAIAALQSGIPINMVSRWLGHAKLETTAHYAGAMGEEERALLRKFWREFAEL